MSLSVIVPVYNERETVLSSVGRLLEIRPGMPLQVVVVDNGSTDGTWDRLDRARPALEPRGVRLERTAGIHGKGEAVRYGLKLCSGEFLLVHDADLEYDPRDIPALLDPLIAGTCDLVNGTRFGRGDAQFLFGAHALANRLLTTAAGLAFGRHLTDLTSCYKAARLTTYRALDLRSRGFELETEILCKAFRRGLRMREVPIRYRARGVAEGKKIRLKDLIPILGMMGRVRLGD